MTALSVGVSSIGDALPRAVYALLSGLNAATVGIIALAAMELSDKAITDRLTRVLVFLTAAAAILYNALWYFPVLMSAAGIGAVIYDFRWLHRLGRSASLWLGRISNTATSTQPPRELATSGSTASQARIVPGSTTRGEAGNGRRQQAAQSLDIDERVIPEEYRLDFSWKQGVAIIAGFFTTFIVIMVLRGVLDKPPLLYRLFANMYLAGTIIFGGGPVVIPLLREYIVAEGWVSPRDFLIGLAIIQALPGPNFNFAVYLGASTAINGGHSFIVGSLIAFFGIFTPGMVLVQGTMGVWGKLRSRPWVKSVVRGVNAGAVGLVYTAVYRIWQVGYIDAGFQSGRSLGDDPWWVVVTAAAFVGGRFFGVVAPLAILLGAVLGLLRYAVVEHT